MSLPRLRLLIGLVACWQVVVISHAETLPFTVNDPEGQWHSRTIRRVYLPDVIMESVIGNANLTTRFMIMSSLGVKPDLESLIAFSHRLKVSFTPGTDPDAVEKTETKIGFEGRDLTFELSDKDGVYRCELFVFAEGKTGWAILYLTPKRDTSRVPFEILRKADAVPQDVVGMQPMVVKDDPLTSFPISFSLAINRPAGRIAKIIVSQVPPYSSTALAGVKEGDEVLSINGRKSQEFASGVGKKSELGLILMNRSSGDEVDLEIFTPGDKKPRTVTLRVPGASDAFGYYRHD